jgi:GAF domain-containing protein
VAAETASGNHFSCTMSAVLIGRVHDYGGDAAVRDVMRRAGIARPVADLLDITNWISYGQAVALWRAGAEVTHHPQFARWVGEDAARRLNGSPVATLLRSLGSPENVFRQIATTATKYTTVSVLEAVDGGPGWAEIAARPVNGFARSADHCAWTAGLLSQPTRLFGLGPAEVVHDECAAFGAPACIYRLSWRTTAAAQDGSSEQIETLRQQLDAMKERLHSMFQTAGDLIGSGDVDDVLARIAERAAVEVRAPRHLLAVSMSEGGRTHCHHKGFDPAVVGEHVDQLLHRHPRDLPENWLVVPVRSTRHDYGRLLAAYDEGVCFFPQERELLEVYARYAASALDSATALLEAESRYAQSSALLELARALAAAGTNAEVARRLADSVPTVVDCDQVGVYIWDAGRAELVRTVITPVADGAPAVVSDRSSWPAVPGGMVERLLRDPNPMPLFLDSDGCPDSIGAIFAALGFAATVLVPLAARDQLLGLLTVSVRASAERLTPSADLLDRLSGVAAQATTALQNGRLVDVITHQALHDQLTGLANRLAVHRRVGRHRGSRPRRR